MNTDNKIICACNICKCEITDKNKTLGTDKELYCSTACATGTCKLGETCCTCNCS